MQRPISPNNSILSPKRKRDAQDSPQIDAPSQSRLRTTNLPSRPPAHTEIPCGGSPSSTVAGHLQGLKLEPYNDIPHLDFSKSHAHTSGGPIVPSMNESGFNPHIWLPSRGSSAPATPPHSSDGVPLTTFSYPNERPPMLEIPETPRLRPVSSPTPPPSAKTSLESKATSLPSPSQKLWWDDSEITGHDPRDPSDDGYGINGIGFLPTPAIANSRLERRKKQVAEWKNREAREARQKRSDRRRRRDAEAVSVGNPLVRDNNAGVLEDTRKVRFLEV